MNNDIDDILYKAQQEYFKRPYKMLVDDICELIGEEIVKEDLSLVRIESRVKKLESIHDKIVRNNIDYFTSDLFEKITDIAGVRVICTLSSDIDKIKVIINKLFNVHSEESKYEEVKNKEFGYFDIKYIVSLKKEHPHKGISYLYCEVQITTAAMNLWADVSHLLLYKKSFSKNLSNEMQREIFATSALLYVVDKQFEKLIRTWEGYIHILDKTYNEDKQTFLKYDYSYETLYVLLNCYFRNKKHATRDKLFEFYEKTKKEYETIGDVYSILEKTKDALNNFNQDQIKHRHNIEDIGFLRTAIILDMMHKERDWEHRMEWVKKLQKYDKYIR